MFFVHSISYSLFGKVVCTFTWYIRNVQFDWLAAISSSAALRVGKANTLGRNVGKLGRKSALENEEFYTPTLFLKNNQSIKTPSFIVDCKLDGVTYSWDNCTIDANQSMTYKIGEEAAKKHMGIGKHKISYSISGNLLCQLDWEIRI